MGDESLRTDRRTDGRTTLLPTVKGKEKSPKFCETLRWRPHWKLILKFCSCRPCYFTRFRYFCPKLRFPLSQNKRTINAVFLGLLVWFRIVWTPSGVKMTKQDTYCCLCDILFSTNKCQEVRKRESSAWTCFKKNVSISTSINPTQPVINIH